MKNGDGLKLELFDLNKIIKPADECSEEEWFRYLDNRHAALCYNYWLYALNLAECNLNRDERKKYEECVSYYLNEISKNISDFSYKRFPHCSHLFTPMYEYFFGSYFVTYSYYSDIESGVDKIISYLHNEHYSYNNYNCESYLNYELLNNLRELGAYCYRQQEKERKLAEEEAAREEYYRETYDD